MNLKGDSEEAYLASFLFDRIEEMNLDPENNVVYTPSREQLHQWIHEYYESRV